MNVKNDPVRRVVSGPDFRDKLMIFGIFGKLSLFWVFFGKKSG